MMRPDDLKCEIRRVKILYLRSLFYLRKVQLDLDQINDALEFTDSHKGFLAEYVSRCPEIDIDAEVAKLARKTDRSETLLIRPDDQ